MVGTTRFRINSPQVVHETIDGETIILNLDQGTYYNLDTLGGILWLFIEKGCSLEEISRTMTAHYREESSFIDASISKFLEDLMSEKLLVTMEEPRKPSNAVEDHPCAEMPQEAPEDFSTPALNKYTDMQDLLLLDPIHDVDDTGWPSVKVD